MLWLIYSWKRSMVSECAGCMAGLDISLLTLVSNSGLWNTISWLIFICWQEFCCFSCPASPLLLFGALHEITYFYCEERSKRLCLCNKLCLFCFTCPRTVALSGERHCFQCIKSFQDTTLHLCNTIKQGWPAGWASGAAL